MNSHRAMGPVTVGLLIVCSGFASTARGAITPPRLDDRSYRTLVEETAARIPAHSPEWTNYNDSDPGVSLLELFDVLGTDGINALLDEFKDVPPWTTLGRDDEQYWSELGYVTMEAGLVLIASNHQIGTDWPQRYWPQTYPDILQQEFESFSYYANLPEPTAVTLWLAVSGSCLLAVRRR